MIAAIYLLVFLTLYFIIVFVIPSARVKRKTGINPYVFKNTDSPQDYIARVLTAINIIIFAVVLLNLLFPEGLQYLATFIWLEISILKYAGFAIIHLALLWIVIAQVQMNNSWRVGIDHSAKTELKINGLFSISRNPVFLGMLITLMGIFLILPNAITLLTLISSILLLQIQTRLEEEYLRNTYGEVYIEYCRKVGRWF